MTTAPKSEQHQEIAIGIVEVALRVLKTRDGIDISSDLITERSRNIVTALGSEFDLVPFAAVVERSTQRLAALNRELEALCSGGAR